MNNNDKVQDATLIDSVMGYCAKNNVEMDSLSNLTFKEVCARLALTCMNDPIYVWASREVRRYYPICHPECHIERIKALVSCGGVWPEGSGPNQVVKEHTDNVVEFPTNHTRH